MKLLIWYLNLTDYYYFEIAIKYTEYIGLLRKVH